MYYHKAREHVDTANRRGRRRAVRAHKARSTCGTALRAAEFLLDRGKSLSWARPRRAGLRPAEFLGRLFE